MLSRSTAMLEKDMDMIFSVIRGIIALVASGTTKMDKNGIAELFTSLDSVIADGFLTTHRRRNILQGLSSYIKPEQKQMGTLTTSKKKDGTVDDPVFFSSFSLKKIIEVLISMPEVCNVLTASKRASTSRSWASMMDGDAMEKAKMM
ncbi:hypothetical protein PFISCL1PPCAC_26214, partial [Pristionchus fissidentatus]